MSKLSSKRPLHSPMGSSNKHPTPSNPGRFPITVGQCPGAKGVSSSATALACRLILGSWEKSKVGKETTAVDDDIEEEKKTDDSYMIWYLFGKKLGKKKRGHLFFVGKALPRKVES